MIKNIFNHLINILFPVECLGCEWYGAYVCDVCLNSIRINEESMCLQCHKHTLLGRICKECEEDFYVDRVLYAADYDQELVHKLIWNMKYNFVKKMGESIALILTKYIQQHHLIMMLNLAQAVLVPIPLHKKRFKYRGFNQAEEISKALSEITGWEVDVLLERNRNTSSQLGYNKKERMLNMKNAFQVIKNIPETVILIDDVVTTGETLNQAAKVLKEGGAKKVYALVVAKRE